jgi:DNA recombination protein RmuC
MIWISIVLSLIVIGLGIALFVLLSERLKELSTRLQETHTGVGQRLDNAASVINNLHNTLGKLEKTNEQIVAISKDISGLQNLLRAPKFRGEMGETLLGNLLEQVLPKEHYRLQYQFKSGDTVDAAVILGVNIMPIDAKFPLENFQGLINSTDENEKNAFRKRFVTDVKNRINEISSKYILPDEKTFDFAMMYIPAENIYYETTIKEELLSYALSRKVVPVSPSTFYAYLQVILLGLKGMQVERNAKDILANLNRMQQDLFKFTEDFRLVGGHIQNARAKFDEAKIKLDKFQEKLISSSNEKHI